MPHAILAFLPIAAIMAVMPGTNTALVLRSSTAHGLGHARVTTLGITTGVACHAVAAVVGLSAVIAASGTAMDAIKWAGAAYLCYLGVETLRSLNTPVSDPDTAQAGVSYARSFRQGLTSSLLNPKVILLFLALLPHFIPTGPSRTQITVMLSAVFVGLCCVWMLVLARMGALLRDLLNRPRIHRRVQCVTGLCLTGLGIALLVT